MNSICNICENNNNKKKHIYLNKNNLIICNYCSSYNCKNCIIKCSFCLKYSCNNCINKIGKDNYCNCLLNNYIFESSCNNCNKKCLGWCNDYKCNICNKCFCYKCINKNIFCNCLPIEKIKEQHEIYSFLLQYFDY